MDDILEGLKAKLEGRYEILREVGRGGMATVYLARDLRHPRQVAVKLFRPELAAGASHGRFVREIALASRLSHPNILALYDSGDEDGILYYVMPYVEGESVADRIEREGKLPIADALAIARQVAAALHYAHERGVVHRDIKPDNILLSGDTALVADFGIAHAVESIGSERLTATNLAVGTPAFMSPEQITGAGKLDGRADVYSLGCVLYTMLLGEPPFGGSSMQAILARHLAEPVPHLRVVRSTVPRAVEAAVERAMAKAPVDRFASAAEFAAALAPEHLSDASLDNILRRPQRRRRWLATGVALGVVLVVAFVVKPWSLTRFTSSTALDRHLAAVLPFRTDEIADSSLRVQLASVADLVAQRLPGDGGPRGVTVAGGEAISSQAARDVARAAGAGRVIQGSVASIGDRLVMSATLRDVATDSLLARVDDVAGPRDSLATLLDKLVGGLLVVSTEPHASWQAALIELPLPTIRQYVSANDLLRHGQIREAAQGFFDVLEADSTAFPAALMLASIRVLELAVTESRRPLRLARAQVHRMQVGDTFQVRSLQLWHDGDTTRPWGAAERLDRLESAANANQSSRVQWFLLGERLFHDGPLLGVPDMLRLAAGSFQHVLDLDPEFVPALRHAIDLAAARSDTEMVRDLAPRYFALDSVGELSDFYRWRTAVALGDERALAVVRERLDKFTRPSLERIVNVSQLDGIDLSDALRAANSLWARSGQSNEARWAYVKQRELALNRGRPAEAAAILGQWRATRTGFRPRDGMAEVVNALFWGADTTTPATWVKSHEATSLVVRRPLTGERWDDVYTPVCAVALWQSVRGDALSAERVLGVLQGMGTLADIDGENFAICSAVVSARVAARLGRPDAAARLAHLDSVGASAPPALTWLLTAANITAAQLWEASGDIPHALAAIRRRVYITDIGEQRVLVALSTMLREEGRLATLAGDVTGAITAYRRYLALRDNPEPAITAEVSRVRSELAKLERSP